MTTEKKKKQYTRHLNSYTRYSGMAFQMVFIIAAGVFGGIKLDEWLDTKPLFTLILSVVAVILSLYITIKDALHQTKHK